MGVFAPEYLAGSEKRKRTPHTAVAGARAAAACPRAHAQLLLPLSCCCCLGRTSGVRRAGGVWAEGPVAPGARARAHAHAHAHAHTHFPTHQLTRPPHARPGLRKRQGGAELSVLSSTLVARRHGLFSGRVVERGVSLKTARFPGVWVCLGGRVGGCGWVGGQAGEV